METVPDWTTLRVVSEEEAKLAHEEYERVARANWAKRFEGARAKIPPHFAWIEALKPTTRDDGKGITFAIPDVWRERLPWFTPDRVLRLWNVWKSRANLLLLGPADVGKTCLLVLHAQWTFALAGYDATEIAKARDAIKLWEQQPRKETLVGQAKDGAVYMLKYAPSPPSPEWLPQVKEAQGLRFFTAPELLDERQQGPNEERLREALRSTALYLDEVGREMYGAKGSGHLASGRRAVMMRVLESRWANERRFVATSEYSLDQLAEMYGVGSFRRIAGERSGATVIDLADEQWAGPWLRQQKGLSK